jgi:hypothetical protein
MHPRLPTFLWFLVADSNNSFLSGLQWSCGDLNVRMKGPEVYAKMQNNAAKRGQTSPIELLSRELDGIKLMVATHETEQDLLHAAPLAIEGGAGAARDDAEGEGEGEDQEQEVRYEDEA